MPFKETRKSKSILKSTVLCTLCIVLCFCMAFSSYADAGWPGLSANITAESAIVIDADTKTVLYGKYINDRKYPASITKLMTALIVLEKCSMDEEVVFNASAYKLESGATTALTEVGDVLTVSDCLYALLFKSANEVANALAEHVSGSIDEFSVLMNEKAEELGCRDTHFVNPSGLNDENHYTTAYDMALIGAACFDNEKFLDIEKEDTHRLAPTKAVPNGLLVTVGHKMLRSGTKYSDERVKGGKTGYTMLAGNTLVTLAEDDGRRIVAVCLKDKTPAHYTDTKAMLDFGFSGFKNTVLTDILDKYSVEERLLTDKIITNGGNRLEVSENPVVTLPIGADTEDIELRYDYNISEDAPEYTAARIEFTYADVPIGETYITNEKESELGIEAAENIEVKEEENAGTGISAVVLVTGLVGLLILLASGCLAFFTIKRKREKKLEREKFRQRRRERLKELDMSEEDFDRYVQDRRKQLEERKSGKIEQ